MELAVVLAMMEMKWIETSIKQTKELNNYSTYLYQGFRVRRLT